MILKGLILPTKEVLLAYGLKLKEQGNYSFEVLPPKLPSQKHTIPISTASLTSCFLVLYLLGNRLVSGIKYT